jgi:hypothetical protein
MPVKKSVQLRAKSALKVTPAAKWKRGPAGELVAMPSGNVARLQRVSLEQIAMTGALPDSLSALINEVIQATIQKRDITSAQWEQEWAKRAEEKVDFAQMVRMIDQVAPLVFLEPKIVAQPDYEAGEIALDDVEYPDRQFAFTWAMGEVGLLVNFFPESPGGVPALPGS